MLQRLNQTMRLTLTAGVLAMPTLALADLPPVLDRITPDASVVISTSSIGDALAGFEALAEIGFGDFNEVTGAISSIGGLNTDGSAAMGMFVTEDMTEEGPDMFLVLPISDYGALLKSLDGEGGGVAEVFIEGEAAYLTDMGGGYALIGSTKSIAERYADVRGSAGAFETMLGSAGEDAADASTIFVAVNLEQLRPMLADSINSGIDMMEQGAEMQGQNLGPMIDIYRTLGSHIAEEGQSFVFGVGFQDAGITLNTSAQFTDGSEAAKLLTGNANSSGMLARVPNKPFFMAMAVDASGGLFRAAAEFGVTMSQMQAQAMGMDMPEMDADLISGYASVVGSPPGGIMGGLLTATTTYMATSDPKAIQGMKEKQISGMNELAVPMVGFDGSYTKEATTIAGHDVDAWSLGFEFDSNDPSMMQAQMIVPLLFGPGGFGGFSTAVEGGLVETMSQNPRLMEAAIEAAQNGGGLSTNESIRSVAKYLPSNRAFEFYIGAEEVFTMAGALAAMGQLPADFELPEGVPPIATGFGYNDGGAQAAVFVPIEVIQFGAQVGEMMGGMGGDF
jgi:hypothetical protein